MTEINSTDDEEFYLKMPYLALIDKDIWKGKNPWNYDIGKLLPEFFDKMKENLKFKILGLALQTAAQIHYAKILYLIQSEEKFKEHLEIERKRHESAALGRLGLPLRRFGEEADVDDLFNELVDVLLEEKRRLKRKIEREKKLKEKRPRKRRVPLSESFDIDDFYEVDADRMNIQEKNEMVKEAIKRLCHQAPNGEITFNDLLKDLTHMASDPRIQTARVLLSVLFLIADGFIFAEQDVDTHQIFIQLMT
ncbi:MAG: hypothetical protein ACTSYB_10830 [Candidatus Helarchaeota archaeon]